MMALLTSAAHVTKCDSAAREVVRATRIILRVLHEVKAKGDYEAWQLEFCKVELARAINRFDLAKAAEVEP